MSLKAIKIIATSVLSRHIAYSASKVDTHKLQNSICKSQNVTKYHSKFCTDYPQAFLTGKIPNIRMELNMFLGSGLLVVLIPERSPSYPMKSQTCFFPNILL